MDRKGREASLLFSIALLASIHFLSGCQQRGWVYQETLSDYPQFNSALLSYSPSNTFNGIELQFIRGEFGILGFLNVFSRQIPCSKIFLTIGEYQYLFLGTLMEGSQKLLLPPAATDIICRSLLSNQMVTITLEGYSEMFYPKNFSKKHTRLQQMYSKDSFERFDGCIYCKAMPISN